MLLHWQCILCRKLRPADHVTYSCRKVNFLLFSKRPLSTSSSPSREYPQHLTAPKSGTPWTKDDADTLSRLRAEGVPFKDIARQLGRTYHAVSSRYLMSDWQKPTSRQHASLEATNLSTHWSHDETEALLTMHSRRKLIADMSKTLNRSYASISCKLRRLTAGKSDARRQPWTDEETEALLTMHEQGKPTTEIAQTLKRSVNSIEDKLDRCFVGNPHASKERWSEDQDKQLLGMKSSGTKSLRAIAAVLGRSTASVYSRFLRLCQSREFKKHQPFSKDEDQLLMHLRFEQGKTFSEIQRSMPSRSSSTLGRRFGYLSTSSTKQAERLWTEDDLATLERLHASSESWTTIALRLERSVTAVKSRAWKHFGSTDPNVNTWTPEEESTLIHCRQDLKMAWKDIARQLGRTVSSCKNKMYRHRV